jgi:hypothetical protein
MGIFAKRKLGRLTITLSLIIVVALTLNAYDLRTGIGAERVLQTRSTTPCSPTHPCTTTSHTTRRTTTHTTSSSTGSSISGPCPAGVVCSSSSSSSSSSSTGSSISGPCPAGVVCSSSSSSSSSSVCYACVTSVMTTTSSSTTGPGCLYFGIFRGTVRNTTTTTTIITTSSTWTNQTNSTRVETTCAIGIPGFPLEGTIIGAVVGLLFVMMSRSKTRRVTTN